MHPALLLQGSRCPLHMETGVRPCCRLHLLKCISQNKYNQARVAVYVTCAGHRHCLCCVLQVGRYCCRARCSRHLPAQQQTSATMINALILGSLSLQRLEETSRRPKGCCLCSHALPWLGELLSVGHLLNCGVRLPFLVRCTHNISINRLMHA